MLRRPRRLTLLCALLLSSFAGLLVAPPPASAARANSVSIELGGGDASAVSACVNLALAKAKLAKGELSDSERRRLEKEIARETKRCKNKADATAGDVRLRGVSVKVMQLGPDGQLVESSMNLDGVVITLAGGDATALATCVNVVEGDADAVRQEDECDNAARARGGKLRLRDVEIVIVTGTGGTAALTGAQLNLTGGDAAAISACVNAALNPEGDVTQRNTCTNKASAQGGDLRLTDVTLEVQAAGALDLQKVTVSITGGDATAIAACVNIVEGDAETVDQRNKCRNAAKATGGDLILRRVTIMVLMD